jgi:repressor of nif and glnA expression
MRKHGEVVTQADERILEFLDEHGNHRPTPIRDALADNGMEYSQNHIGERCRQLADHGLLVNVGGGTYSITNAGRDFLTGDLNAGTLTTGTGD